MIDRIRAPYNFVPLSPLVVFPEWANDGEFAPHDWPFKDGISGTFEIEITALTPIFTRGAGSQRNEFFKTPDDKYAIPGSSIRGMLRNVVEIATFSKMNRVNDHRYAVRDLQNAELYLRHMADLLEVTDGSGDKKKEPVPLVTAGWMYAQDDEDFPAVIEPCSFAKVHYAKLKAMAERKRYQRFAPGRRQTSVDKYESWSGSRDVNVSVFALRGPDDRGNSLGEYGEVESLENGPISGTLVFTGQPQRWPPDRTPPPGSGWPKHHDFVFYLRPGEKHQPIHVPRRTFRDFEFAHADRGQQNRNEIAPNPEWKYWKRKFDQGEKVPVFFLRKENGDVRAIGLAMMFRLAYEYSVGEALRRHQMHSNDKRIDMAEAIFGRVPGDGSTGAGAAKGKCLRGRVSFGLATQKTDNRPEPPVTAVLAAPKASYYPTYIEQGVQSAEETVQAYWTLMDEEARLRGWKRYRPREEDRGSKPSDDSDRVSTTFCPLPAGTRFAGRVRVHNLRPEELGALLWALDFGGASDAFHTLGMARPLGFGRVELGVRSVDLKSADGSTPDTNQCVERFRNYMESKVKGGWFRSPQITELLACAKPIADGSDEGRYMVLGRGRGNNEFVEAKKRMLALAPAGGTPTGRQKLPQKKDEPFGGGA